MDFPCSMQQAIFNVPKTSCICPNCRSWTNNFVKGGFFSSKKGALKIWHCRGHHQFWMRDSSCGGTFLIRQHIRRRVILLQRLFILRFKNWSENKIAIKKFVKYSLLGMLLGWIKVSNSSGKEIIPIYHSFTYIPIFMWKRAAPGGLPEERSNKKGKWNRAFTDRIHLLMSSVRGCVQKWHSHLLVFERKR